mgnify:CR=1 FL=1
MTKNPWPIIPYSSAFRSAKHTVSTSSSVITPENDSEYKPAQFYYTDAISDNVVKCLREHGQSGGDKPRDCGGGSDLRATSVSSLSRCRRASRAGTSRSHP